MSETSQRVFVSNQERRGRKEYWKREALRLAGELVALEARLEAQAADLKEIGLAGVEFQDGEVSYVAVPIDRDLWRRLRAAAGAGR